MDKRYQFEAPQFFKFETFEGTKFKKDFVKEKNKSDLESLLLLNQRNKFFYA